MAGYRLDHVGLAARDVAATCRFLADGLGLKRRTLTVDGVEVATYPIGESALAVFECDHPFAQLDGRTGPGVRYVAFRCESPEGAVHRHGFTTSRSGTGPEGRRYAALSSSETGGTQVCFIEPSPTQGTGHDAGAAHVQRLDHIGIASQDNELYRRVFSENLGCAVESTQTDIELRNVTESFVSDKYGALYHTRPPEILGGLRALFITVGDCELEVLSDYDATLRPRDQLGESAGNTKDDQSAIARFIERRGPGLAHVAFAASDIDALLSRLAQGGWRLIDQRGRPGGRGSRIGFVHPSNFGGGLLFHLVEPAA